MVGLMQIMIYLFCAYLIYKGVEIFQIAYTSSPENYQVRKKGVVLGIISIIVAIVISLGAITLTEEMVSKIGENLDKLNR